VPMLRILRRDFISRDKRRTRAKQAKHKRPKTGEGHDCGDSSVGDKQKKRKLSDGTHEVLEVENRNVPCQDSGFGSQISLRAGSREAARVCPELVVGTISSAHPTPRILPIKVSNVSHEMTPSWELGKQFAVKAQSVQTAVGWPLAQDRAVQHQSTVGLACAVPCAPCSTLGVRYPQYATEGDLGHAPSFTAAAAKLDAGQSYSSATCPAMLLQQAATPSCVVETKTPVSREAIHAEASAGKDCGETPFQGFQAPPTSVKPFTLACATQRHSIPSSTCGDSGDSSRASAVPDTPESAVANPNTSTAGACADAGLPQACKEIPGVQSTASPAPTMQPVSPKTSASRLVIVPGQHVDSVRLEGAACIELPDAPSTMALALLDARAVHTITGASCRRANSTELSRLMPISVVAAQDSAEFKNTPQVAALNTLSSAVGAPSNVTPVMPGSSLSRDEGPQISKEYRQTGLQNRSDHQRGRRGRTVTLDPAFVLDADDMHECKQVSHASPSSPAMQFGAANQAAPSEMQQNVAVPNESEAVKTTSLVSCVGCQHELSLPMEQTESEQAGSLGDTRCNASGADGARGTGLGKMLIEASGELGAADEESLSMRPATTSASAMKATSVSGQRHDPLIAPIGTIAGTLAMCDASDLVCTPRCPVGQSKSCMQMPMHMQTSAPPSVCPVNSSAKAFDMRNRCLSVERKCMASRSLATETCSFPGHGPKAWVPPAPQGDIASMHACAAATAASSAAHECAEHSAVPSAGMPSTDSAALSNRAQLTNQAHMVMSNGAPAEGEACKTLHQTFSATTPASNVPVVALRAPATEACNVPSTWEQCTPISGVHQFTGRSAKSSGAQKHTQHGRPQEAYPGQTATLLSRYSAGPQSKRPSLEQGATDDALSRSQRADHMATQSSFGSLSKQLEAFVQPAVARVLRSKCVWEYLPTQGAPLPVFSLTCNAVDSSKAQRLSSMYTVTLISFWIVCMQ
jgi:hypothetical protein